MASRRKYPRIHWSYPEKIPKHRRTKECCVEGCGVVASRMYWVQTSWFRGEDEGPYYTCKEHAREEIVLEHHRKG